MNIYQHYVGPNSEDDELGKQWCTINLKIQIPPEVFLSVDDNLHTFKAKQLKIITFSESMNEIETIAVLFAHVRHVQEHQFHWLQLLSLVKKRVLNHSFIRPNSREKACVISHRWCRPYHIFLYVILSSLIEHVLDGAHSAIQILSYAI